MSEPTNERAGPVPVPVPETVTVTDLAPRSAQTTLTRRRFVGLLVVSAAATALPIGCEDPTSDTPVQVDPVPPGPRFFTDAERQTLAVVCDYILPPDEDGAYKAGAELGGVAYIEALLTALETDPPRLFAGGPLSDRNPFPGPDGQPSADYPADGFSEFIPLTREQELDWRILLYGSAAVPGGAPNDALLGPVIGLRQQFRDNLASLLTLTKRSPAELRIGDVDDVWRRLPESFRATVARLVVESAVCPPEYGGNINREGWRMIHFLGDTAPLGFTPYDQLAGSYRTRPGEPFSERDTRPDPDPMDSEIRLQLEIAVAAIGGRKFY